MKRIRVISLVIFSICLLMGCQIQSDDNNEIDKEDTKNVSEEITDVESHGNQTDTSIAEDKKHVYKFPHEADPHEGTWLQWPHDYSYEGVIEAYEPIWIEMTRALVKGENVHIIVYNKSEEGRLRTLLINENIDLKNIDFFVMPFDDVWVRDNGPIFVYDEDNNLVIEDWQFNGWGNKAPYKQNDVIPSLISEAIGIRKIDIDMVMEGGALELDGNGTCVSTLSCVNNDNRTSNFTLEEIEVYISQYYGVENFIWLNGVAGYDITDNHIDGIMKFYDEKTIVATSLDGSSDSILTDDPNDIDILLSAKNIDGQSYEYVFLPPTKEDVLTYADGDGSQEAWVKGSYINYYVANGVVLVPNYQDENDDVANKIIQDLYPKREIVGIDIRTLYAHGGMIHCVTQQQPVDKSK